MKNLVIVESPSKSKTIEKYLGKDFTVVSSKGHIRDLATRGKDGLGIDVENNFTPTYVIAKGKKDVVNDLKKQVAACDKVYLATDPDREGEAISWHLANELEQDIDDVNRVVFNEITHDAVIEAFKHPRKIDINLVKSQETRRMLDRIIGFKLSKLLKNKIKSKSAGRVQSVALKLIVEKEKEIKAFVPEEYWTIEASFLEDGKQFNAALTKIDGNKAKIASKDEADEILARLNDAFVLDKIKTQVRKKDPKLPFITSTLQQEASTKLGFSAKKTMSVAQKLYEGIELANGLEGIITYMRTDSTRLSNVFIASAKEHIANTYGNEYVGYYKVKNDASSQDAHEAIRPSNLANEPEKIKQYLSNDEYKLYKLIYARALASLMASAKVNTISYNFSQNGCELVANGSQLAFDGYLKLYADYETTKDVLLPQLAESQSYKAQKITSDQHFTEPPLRYSEARLIKEMEELGIGRPSTYSTIIDTIQARGYVELKKATASGKTKVFFPTEQGELTSAKLDEFFSSIINVQYTAMMEDELDQIADGKEDNIAALQAFWAKFDPLVLEAYEKMEKIQPEEVGEKCPECGNELVYRNGRYGRFISCSTFPACKYTRKIESDKPKAVAEPTGKMCPKCGSELLKRKSRFNTFFLGCSSYPKCQYMETLDGQVIEPKKKAKRGKK
ncbi:MAG: type I DNA topoisomerase [Erysipelotrichaceae bacterium]|nr:type I DNA topoisomerase [Erysipelotrichaceae bacterium]MDY5252697.1 type I DNA topoisomerase [Erysipelotrichaceae bacterium]